MSYRFLLFEPLLALESSLPLIDVKSGTISVYLVHNG